MSIWQDVNDWMLQRGRDDGDEFVQLCGLWVDVALRYGDDSSPACGCLIALVRKAWGDEYEIRISIEADGAEVSIYWSALYPTSGVGFVKEFLYETLGLALAAALLAAPVKAGEA
jgi:hypothetical protein